jgi:alcohol dehydrogenase
MADGEGMRAVVCEAGQVRFVADRPAAAAGSGEALVRVRKALVTRVDVEIASGVRRHAGVMGQAFVGEIEQALGEPQLVGRRVVASPDVICGMCDLCRGGLSRHCRDRVSLGRDDRDGCFCGLVRVPVRNLVEVARAVDDDAAPLAGVVAAALHAALHIELGGKTFVSVIGDGLEGLACAQVIAPLNATVRVLGWRPERLGLCEKWQIRHRHANEAGRRRDQTVVIDSEGSARSMALAAGLLRPRGTLIMMAAPGGETLDLRPIVEAELEVRGSRAGSLQEAMALLGRGGIDAASLIGRRVRLEEAPGAIAAVASGNLLSALIDIG